MQDKEDKDRRRPAVLSIFSILCFITAGRLHGWPQIISLAAGGLMLVVVVVLLVRPAPAKP
jgi:hypothetical protein